VYEPFGTKLVERGWPAAIPLIQGEKRPAISGWQTYNTEVVSLEQAEYWARQFPNCGIGHAAGHGLVGVDLDTDQETQAATAKFIADKYLGPTPMIRVGRHPRVMRYYRLDGGDNGYLVTSSFHLFALYITTGQTAWFGIHPGTAKPYEWVDASPLNVGPGELPAVTKEMLSEFVSEMQATFPAPEISRQHTTRKSHKLSLTEGGITTSIMREIALSPFTQPIEIALNWISTAPTGTRHYTMVGAVTALVHSGLDDQQIFNAVVDAHVNSVAGDRPDAPTIQIVKNAIQWARSQVGMPLSSLDQNLGVDNWSIWK
jgi:hypothetical protein